MRKADYSDIITLLGNPDTVAEGLVKLSDKLTVDEAEFGRLTESNNSLRDTNAKLALRITEPVKVTEPEKEKTDEEIFNDLFTSQFNKED